MKVELVHITTRRSGREARRTEVLDQSILTIGRGTDKGLTLPDLTVSINHAQLVARLNGIYIAATSTAAVRINNSSIGGEMQVNPGDRIRIGPYELTLQPLEADFSLRIEVREVERRGTTGEALAENTRTGVERGLFDRRRLSWGIVLVLFAGCLLLPWMSGIQGAWSSGEISRPHAHFGDDCQSCHSESFRAVDDKSCFGECHLEIGAHTPDPHVELDQTRCATCHDEHNGLAGLAELDQRLCADCHEDLPALDSNTVAQASDFTDEGHPEFRVHLVFDLKTGRTKPALVTKDLVENSGLKFSHYRHVGQPVENAKGAYEYLPCGDCHETDAGGKYMKPIEYERHCKDCHELTVSGVTARHGEPNELLESLEKTYSLRVYRGEQKNARQAPKVVKFYIPGKTPTPSDKTKIEIYVREEAERTRGLLMTEVCQDCHSLTTPGGRRPTVVPVRVAEVWMPKARFLHRTHEAFDCMNCHPAAAVFDPDYSRKLPRPKWASNGGPYTLVDFKEDGVAPSKLSSDVMIPGKAPCLECHGGEDGGPGLTPSECILCHSFHRDDTEPLRLRTPHEGE
jgi:hypothetical protein